MFLFGKQNMKKKMLWEHLTAKRYGDFNMKHQYCTSHFNSTSIVNIILLLNKLTT